MIDVHLSGCHICESCGLWEQKEKLGVLLPCSSCGETSRYHDPEDILPLIVMGIKIMQDPTDI